MKIGLACGGTGGHIYPALAIATELKSKHEVFFIGGGRLEKDLVPRAGFRFFEIPASAKKPLAVIKGFFQSLKILRLEKPELMIFTGGYVTFPVAVASLLLGIPYYLQEQNVLPGKVNRLLSLLAKKVFISYADAQKYFPLKNTLLTGNPVRPEIEAIQYNPAAEKILVFGGSLAAKSINEAIEPLKKDPAIGLQLIHLDGKNYAHDMASLYKEAKFVICRAGATTLAELATIGMPSILIPYPHAADNHQEINARSFVQSGASLMILDKDLSSVRLQEAIGTLTQQKLGAMSQAMLGLAKNKSAIKICENLI